MLNEEKVRQQVVSETFLKNHFSLTSAFWGIDSVILRLDADILFQDTVFKTYESSTKDKVKIIRDSFGNINFIDIKSKEFGKLTIGKRPYSQMMYCHLQLNNVGPNFETASQEGIISRLKSVLTHIDDHIGIVIEPKDVHYKKIELSFTYASKQDVHPQLAALLVRSLARDSQLNFNTIKIKKPSGSHPIISSKKKNNRTITHYDKMLKAVAVRQIKKETLTKFSQPIHVSRIEICLQDSAIKNTFGTSRLLQISDLKIIQYLEGIISVGICKFIQEYKDSIKNTNQALTKTYMKIGQQKYVSTFFANQLNKALKEVTPLTLDEEIFCFITFKNTTNLARTRRRLIKQSQNFSIENKETYFLSSMVSWHCIRIFRLMFDSLDYAKQTGLGCIKDNHSKNYHAIDLSPYSIKEKNKIFEKIITNNQKNKQINIEKHIIGKLMNSKNDLF